MKIKGKTLVFSDIHFGVKECTLGIWSEYPKFKKGEQKENEKNIESLFKYLNELKDVYTVIFLGDIFDLHLSNLSSAIKASTLFFQKFQEIKTLREIIYIPGNHDHLLWILHVFKKYVIDELDGGPSSVVSNDFKVCTDIISGDNIFENEDSFLRGIFGLKLDIKVCYPFVEASIADSKYFFTHGHFFDNVQTLYYNFVKKLYPQAAKLFRYDFKGITNPNINEFESYCSPLYEMFKMFGHTAPGRLQMKSLYETYEKFKWGRDKDLDNKKLVKRIKEVISRFGSMVGSNNYFYVMDYLVFGHTHYADINMFLYPSPKVKSINTGCWLLSNDCIGSFLMIDPSEEYPILMLMDKKRNFLEHAASIEMRNDERPRKKRNSFL